MSLIKDIKTLLEQSGFTDKIWLGQQPELTDKDNFFISLHATGGYARDNADGVEEPTFQFYVRSKKYEWGTKPLEKIKDLLFNQTEIVIENTKYLSFYQQSDIMELGIDKKKCFNFSLNYRVYMKRNFDRLPGDIAEARKAVERAEKSKDRRDIDFAQSLVNQLPINHTDRVSFQTQLDVIYEYNNLLKEAIESVNKAETSRLKEDFDIALPKVETLTNHPEKPQLLGRLEILNFFILKSNEVKTMGKILIDFGLPQYSTEGNINNMTGYKSGSILTNMIDTEGIATGVSIQVVNSFHSIGTNNILVDKPNVYHPNTIKDYFYSYSPGVGMLKIFNLDPNKFYRVTVFGSHDTWSSSDYLIRNDTQSLNQYLYLNTEKNLDKTVSSSLKPNSIGEIYVRCDWPTPLNAMEIEELPTI